MRQSPTEEDVLSVVRELACATGGQEHAAAISRLTEVTADLPLTSLDNWERLLRCEIEGAERQPTVFRWKFWRKPLAVPAWLELVSRDGYRRERALWALTATPNAFFFSLLLRRLNDWVPQVRKVARIRLSEIVEAVPQADVIAALLGMLPHWSAWGRLEDDDREALLQLLSIKPVADQLIHHLITSASGPMPAVFSQLGRSQCLDDRLEEVAASAVQPALRAKAYRSLFEGRLVWLEERYWVWTDIRYCEGRMKASVGERSVEVEVPFADLLECSAADASSKVRRVAAEMLIRELNTLGDAAQQFAERFAADTSRPVAERGSFALRKLQQDAEADGMLWTP